MDQYIRSLLFKATQDVSSEKLHEAYRMIKAEERKGSESLSPDLYVTCAETAISINLVRHYDLIEEALALYASLKPKENQFLARSYLCYASLHRPNSSRETDKLEKCNSFIMKAIEFGLSSQRYHFIVMNSSILFWKLARPFLFAQSLHHVCKMLGVIVNALKTIQIDDTKWLLNVYVTYIESLCRSDELSLAETETQAIIKFAKDECTEDLPTIVSKLSKFSLINPDEMSTLPLDVMLIYEVNNLKTRLKKYGKDRKLISEVDDVIAKILEGAESEQVHVVTSDSLLFEVAITCLQHRIPDKVLLCFGSITKPVTDTNFKYRIKFAQADLIVKSLNEDEMSYKKSVLSIRGKAISNAQEALVNARKDDCDAATIQSGCTTLWNLCLPLLQPNLRHMILSCLQIITTLLEDIDSMSVLLRCQAHMELAKCFEDQEKLVDALEHFNKALTLDPEGKYKDTIKHFLKSINLRTNVYQKPQSVDEKAGFLLEQAKMLKNSRSGIQPLLLKIGNLLAPSTFNWGLNELSENSTNCNSIIVLREKIIKYREASEKGKAEMDRLQSYNTHERFLLWGSLAKLARKEKIWEVALTASRFTLWFEGQHSIHGNGDDETESVRKSLHSRTSSFKSERHQHHSDKPAIDEKAKLDAILLCEMHFIYAESLLYFLMQEGIALGQELNTLPNYLHGDASKLDFKEWNDYQNWNMEVQNECIQHFLSGGQQGLAMQEWWLVNNACVYIWNYLKESIDGDQHDRLLDWLLSGYNLLLSAKSNADFRILCNFSEVICKGYLKKSHVENLPSGGDSSTPTGKSKSVTPSKAKSRASPRGKGKKGQDITPGIDPSIAEDITKAITILETCYQKIVGKQYVHLLQRRDILCLWVKCKKILQQPIKSLLPDQDQSDGFSIACKSIVAVEMHTLNSSQSFAFPNTPSMQETLKMVEKSKWTSMVIELEVWTKIAMLALKQANKDLVNTCCEKIGQLKENPDLRSEEHSKSGNTFLCHYSVILGESKLRFGATDDIETRIKALEYFRDAIEYASNAKDYFLALEVGKYYWNAILPLLKNKSERKIITPTLRPLLKVLVALAPDKNIKIRDPTKEQRDIQDLRAHLYSALFLNLADEKAWSTGLEECELASTAMTRPTHPLILKYRVIFKVKMQIHHHGDMAKLERIEQENIVSDMWQRVALASSDQEEQLYAIQQSIMILQSPEYRNEKIECILKLAEWLYVNQFPIEDVVNQVDWALDIAIGLKSNDPGKEYMAIDQDNGAHPRDKSTAALSVRTGLTTETGSSNDEEDEFILKPKPLLKYVSTKMEPIEDIEDVERAEIIARILVIRANFLAYSGPHVKNTMITAYSIYIHIMKMCLANIQPHHPATEDKPASREAKKGGKGDTKDAKKGGAREPQASKSISTSLPTNIKDWSTFKVSNDLVTALQHSFDRKTINKTTVLQPDVTVWYVEQLCKQFEMFGFIEFLLPLYYLQIIISSIICNKELTSLIHLKAAKVCQMLLLIPGYTLHAELAYVNQNENDYITNMIHKGLLEGGVIEPTVLRFGLDRRSVRARSIFNGYGIPEILIEKAEILFENGDFKTGLKMLELAKPYVEAYPDNVKLFVGYHHAAALLSASQQHVTDALNHLASIYNSGHDFNAYCKNMVKIIELLLKFNSTHSLQINEEFYNHARQRLFTDCKLKCAVAQKQSSELSTSTIPDVDELVNICKIYERSIEVYDNFGFILELSDSLLELAKLKFKLSCIDYGTDFQKFMILEALNHSEKALAKLNDEVNKLQCDEVLGSTHIKFRTAIRQHHCHLAVMYCYLGMKNAEVDSQYRTAESLKKEMDKKVETFIKEPLILSSLDERFKRASLSALEMSKHNASNALRISKRYSLPLSGGDYLALSNVLSCKSLDLFEDSLSIWDEKASADSVVTRDILCEVKSLRYLTTSTEFLAKAVQLALQKQDHNVLQSACSEVIDKLGVFAPHISVHFLALYQSSVVAEWLNSIIKKALQTPNESKVASMIYQLEAAEKAKNYKLYSQCFDELFKGNLCWKRTLVFENHFDIIKEIDDKRIFIILQHSSCKQFLYSGVIQGLKGLKVSQEPVAGFRKTRVNFRMLTSLSRLWENYKASLHRYMVKLVALFKFEDQSNNRKEMISRLGVETDVQGLENAAKNLEEERKRLNVFYNRIVDGIWNYLKGSIEAFLPVFHKHQDHDSHVVLLPDLYLHDLPLEALPVANMDNLRCLSRDFSLQVHHHRAISYAVSRATDGAAAVAESSKKTLKTPVPPQGGSSARDRNRNPYERRVVADKIALVPPVVDSTLVKYVLNSDSSLPCGKTSYPLRVADLLKDTQAKTQRWSGTIVQNNALNIVDIQEILKSSSAMLYCGIGKLQSIIPADRLACLTLTKTHLHVVADRAVSAFSLRHEAYVDENKETNLLSLDTAVSLAGILYLTGSSLTLINTHEVTCDDNIEMFVNLISGTVTHDTSVGVALHMLKFPPQTPSPIPSSPASNGEKRRRKSARPQHQPHPQRLEAPHQHLPSSAEDAPDAGLAMLKDLDPVKFNMVPFGLPNVTLSDAAPVKGKK